VVFNEPSSFETERTRVRARRAAVLAGVGLVWAAFMVAIGFALAGLAVLVVAGAGAAWIMGFRVPRYDVGGFVAQSAARVGRAGQVARRGGAAASRFAALGARHTLAASRVAGASASRQLSTFNAHAAGRLAATPALANRVVKLGGEAVRASRPKLSRRRDPRIDRALVSNSQGIALAKAGKPAEAIDAFDAALSLLADTDDRHHEGQVLVNLGVVHRQVGGDEAARFCWTKALERLEPGTPESERTAELLGVR
jgi:tetratricopeptide (TPR) repeat protein